MGLFNSIKKKTDQSFPPFSAPSVPGGSDLKMDVPDDIPLQMPPQMPQPQRSHDAPYSPPDSSWHKEVSSPLEHDFSQSASSFGPLDDVSSRMLADPENPFEREQRLKQVEQLAYAKPDPASQAAASKNASPIRMPERHDWSFEDASNPSGPTGIDFDAPLFVNVLDFAQILEHIAETKNKMADLSTSIARVHGFQKDRDAQFATYSKTLEAIQKKLIALDKTLFET